MRFNPVCNILGVDVSAVNMKKALSYIESNLKDLSGEYICVANVHTTVMSYDNADYCKIQNDAALTLPDGGPLSVVGRQLGYKQMNRVTGPDLMGQIFACSVTRHYKHYFLGSTQETLDKLHTRLKKEYKGIQIVGMFSPPFREMTVSEKQKIVLEINGSEPDFVWVGLGAPKQEQWMYQHKGKIKGLMIGVGAGFDYYAGNIKRAPEWMQKWSLEWLYRLIQDPKKLWKRYAYTNLKFLWLTSIKYGLGLNKKRKLWKHDDL